MRWLGVFLLIVGFFVYIWSNATESQVKSKSVLVQLVVEPQNQVVSEPFLAVVEPTTQFIKGSGKRGAKFVSTKESLYPTGKYLQMVSLSRIGALMICFLGGVGLFFENWRRKIIEAAGIDQAVQPSGVEDQTDLL